jgi:hypothetical protein
MSHFPIVHTYISVITIGIIAVVLFEHLLAPIHPVRTSSVDQLVSQYSLDERKYDRWIH